MTKQTVRALFLDDDQNRHDAFLKAKFNYEHAEQNTNVELIVTHVHGYYEALSALRKEDFDVVFLDHDLGDCNPNAAFEQAGYGDRYYLSGADLAHQMVQMLGEKLSHLTVIVHSVNPDGAKNIEQLLKPHVKQIVRKKIWTLLEDMKGGTF